MAYSRGGSRRDKSHSTEEDRSLAKGRARELSAVKRRRISQRLRGDPPDFEAGPANVQRDDEQNGECESYAGLAVSLPRFCGVCWDRKMGL